MTMLLRSKTRTHLTMVVNPGPSFLDSSVDQVLTRLSEEAKRGADEQFENDVLSREALNKIRLSARYAQDAKSCRRPAEQIVLDAEPSAAYAKVVAVLLILIAALFAVAVGLAR